MFRDFGYTSGICQTRSESHEGISRPILKPESRCEKIRALFLSLTSVAEDYGSVDWFSPMFCAVYDQKVHATCHAIFAYKISPTNRVEALRVHISSKELPLKCHVDTENSLVEGLTPILGLNRLNGDDGTRFGITGYMCRSIDYAMERESRDAPFLLHDSETYTKLPLDLRIISPRMSNGTTVDYSPACSMIRKSCHYGCPPLAYHLPFTHAFLQLIQHFHLTFPEAISVQCAIEFIPKNSALFFVTAVKTLISCSSTCKIIKTTKQLDAGFDVGYVLILLMKEFHTLVTSRGSLSKSLSGFRRYNVYYTPQVLPWKEWLENFHRKLVLSLFAFACYGEVANRKQRETAYKLLLKKLSKGVKQTGDLATNHSMSIMAQIGLLPHWCRNQIHIPHTNRYMLKHFSTKFYDGMLLSQQDVDRIGESLRVHLGNTFTNKTFSPKKVENILCKIFCADNSNSQFCDLLEKDQFVFCFDGEGVKISSSSGEWTSCSGSYLVDWWPFGDDVLTASEIVVQLCLGKAFPTDTGVSNFVLPNVLLFPTSRQAFEFIVGQVRSISPVTLEVGKRVISVYRTNIL